MKIEGEIGEEEWQEGKCGERCESRCGELNREDLI